MYFYALFKYKVRFLKKNGTAWKGSYLRSRKKTDPINPRIKICFSDCKKKCYI